MNFNKYNYHEVMSWSDQQYKRWQYQNEGRVTFTLTRYFVYHKLKRYHPLMSIVHPN